MSADLIIYAAMGSLVGLGLVSFFVSPSYEKGVWVVLVAISSALSGALGFKFGVTTAASPDGTVSQITTQTTVQEAPAQVN